MAITKISNSGVYGLKYDIFSADNTYNNFLMILNTGTGDYGSLGKPVDIDSLGNLYFTHSFQISGSYASYLIKINQYTQVEWVRTLTIASRNIIASSVYVDGSDIYCVGSLSTASNAEDPYIIKYNSSGVLQWQKTFTASFTNEYSALYASNGVIYAGGTNYNSGTSSISMLAKFDSSGTFSWGRGIDSFGYAYGNGLDVDGSGNVYLCGTTQESSGDYLGYVAKYDSSGTLSWKKRLQTTTFLEEFRSIKVTSAGNVYVSGRGESTYSGIVAKYNTSGTLQWQKRLTVGAGGNTTDVDLLSIDLDSSENVYVAGRVYDNGTRYSVVAKYNSSGTLQWQRSITNATGVSGIKVVGSNIYVSGYDAGSPSKNIIFKIPTDGSKTGTYTVDARSYVYAASSLTDANATGTAADLSRSSATQSYSFTNSTMTDASGSINRYIVGV